MYPLYWTPSKEGIIMRYSFEFKKKAIDLYHQGQWIDPPGDISNLKDYRKEIRRWVRLANANGIEIK